MPGVTYRWTVAVEDRGRTVAAFLRARLPEASWNRTRELCATGRVRLDGDECLDAHVRLRGGEVVEVMPEAQKRTAGVLHPSDLLYLDDSIVVVNKRAGLLTVPYEDGDRDTLVDQVRAFLLRVNRAKSRIRDEDVGVVSRLDKDTTGVVVFARGYPAKRALDVQFRTHTAERRYLALVHGHLRPATYRTFIVPDRGDGLRGSWGTRRSHRGPPPPDAKESITHVLPLEHLRATRHDEEVLATLVECRLETGRQHQIRIHLAEAGHPLVGEAVYVREFRGPRWPQARPLLHSASLSITHPRTGRSMVFESSLPRDFERVLQAFRGSDDSSPGSPARVGRERLQGASLGSPDEVGASRRRPTSPRVGTNL